MIMCCGVTSWIRTLPMIESAIFSAVWIAQSSAADFTVGSQALLGRPRNATGRAATVAIRTVIVDGLVTSAQSTRDGQSCSSASRGRLLRPVHA